MTTTPPIRVDVSYVHDAWRYRITAYYDFWYPDSTGAMAYATTENGPIAEVQFKQGFVKESVSYVLDAEQKEADPQLYLGIATKLVAHATQNATNIPSSTVVWMVQETTRLLYQSFTGKDLPVSFVNYIQQMAAYTSSQQKMSKEMKNLAMQAHTYAAQMNTYIEQSDALAQAKPSDHQSDALVESAYNDFYTMMLKSGYISETDYIKFNGMLSGSTGAGTQASEWAKQPMFRQEVKHPITGDRASLKSVIINLNDTHRWTREQIADWLETLDADINLVPKEDKNDKDS